LLKINLYLVNQKITNEDSENNFLPRKFFLILNKKISNFFEIKEKGNFSKGLDNKSFDLGVL